jgi:hypothetical protein
MAALVLYIPRLAGASTDVAFVVDPREWITTLNFKTLRSGQLQVN